MTDIKITTDNLLLRKFIISDAKRVSQISMQKSIAHEMSDMIMPNELSAVEWIEWINSEAQINKINVLAIINKINHQCIGYLYTHSKSELNNEVELAYAIDDDFQNQGFATEACKAFLRWTFDNKEFNQLVAIAKTENIASQKVLEKLKFEKIDERIIMHDHKPTSFYYYILNKK